MQAPRTRGSVTSIQSSQVDLSKSVSRRTTAACMLPRMGVDWLYALAKLFTYSRFRTSPLVTSIFAPTLRFATSSMSIWTAKLSLPLRETRITIIGPLSHQPASYRPTNTSSSFYNMVDILWVNHCFAVRRCYCLDYRLASHCRAMCALVVSPETRHHPWFW